MGKQRIDRELERKYTRGGSDPGNGPDRKDRPKGTNRDTRNLGLLSLFFILLALVFIVGKFTFEGRFVSSPRGSQSASMPRITHVENLTAPAELESEQPSPLPIEKPAAEKETEPEPLPAVEPAKPEEPPVKEYQSRLFFLKINDEGQILLKSILRTIQYDSGLLTATLESLLTGPSQEDLIKGYFTLIPGDTRLNKVSIRDGIAWIDVTEDFGYNHLGYEGYQAQLKQLIYTATEFSSVKGVRITVNGREKEFLSAEGIDISGILTRESF